MRNTARLTAGLILAAFVVLSGCENNLAGPQEAESLSATEFSSVTGRGFIWADGVLHHTVATPAHFKPNHGPVDVLYTSGPGASFRDGHTSISESKPGDTDYNGGRWHVMVLKESVDPTKYADADSDADLDPADFESTGTFFVCPLHRMNRNA